jgi:DNA-binding MarR family transcriptional regulator
MTGLDRTDQAAVAAGPRDAVAAVPGVEEFNLASNVNYLLRRAHARADFLFSQLMAEIGLTPRQAAILYAAGTAPGCSLTDLSRITGIDRGTIAEMVPRLVRRGLLVQTRASADRRAKALVCTEAGEAAFRFVRERTPALTGEVLRPLPEEYHPLLIKMLRLLVGLERETRTSTIAAARAADGAAKTKD